jgi:hypothetical protein
VTALPAYSGILSHRIPDAFRPSSGELAGSWPKPTLMQEHSARKNGAEAQRLQQYAALSGMRVGFAFLDSAHCLPH